MKLKVCPRCFEKLESQQKAEQLLPGVQKFTLSQISSVPGNTIFDVEDPSSEDLGPVLQPVQPNIKPEQEDDIISKNLDSVLSKRLQNLKSEDNKNLPTDEDISTRLADLKGMPQKNYNYSDLLVSKDHRTEKEKIDDLLKQFVDETAIDSNASRPSSNPIDEIEKRLAALRGTDTNEMIQLQVIMKMKLKMMMKLLPKLSTDF
uniref:Uncharacterized protein n=1 Tax=Megaselia scalaris TaxID=36166 RepID=T1GXM2_MEGSC